MKVYERIDLADMKSAIQAACDANGCPELAEKIQPKWSQRIVQATGQVNLRTYTIQLSAKLLIRLPREKQIEAVVHETCRVIAWHLYQDTSHHKVWHACMLKAGYPDAKRIIEANTKGIRRSGPVNFEKSRYAFRCACRKHFRLNPMTAKAIALDGKHRDCPKCGKLITLIQNQLAARAV